MIMSLLNTNTLLTPTINLPLSSKRIVITAPRNYASRLSQQIINRGGLPFLMPTIETCWLDDYTKLESTFREIEQFDWIAFTSRNGIEAFFQKMKSLNLSTSILGRSGLCALGKDAEKLFQFGIKADLIPEESSPQGIVNELSKLTNIAQQKILVPVPKVVGISEPNIIPNFVNNLEKLGLQVTCVPAYLTQPLQKDLYEVELELIRHKKVEMIAFSSTGEVESFIKMFHSKSEYEHCAVACFGPYTAANARKLGIRVSVVAQDYSSFAGFAKAIAQFFNDQQTANSGILRV